MSVTLIARYVVQSGQANVVESALARMAQAVAAGEPGCLVYDVNVSVDDPNVYCLYEVYQDEDALTAHRETPHFKEIVEGIILPLLERRDREFYRRLPS
jgi:quinol monooxygenase YgiN